MGLGFGDVDCIYLLKIKVQCRNFVVETSGSKTYNCALYQGGNLSSDLFTKLTCLC
jgi:hypothetical protein